MRFFFKSKHEGPEGRVGNHDRRSVGRWATHIWGAILLFAFLSGFGLRHSLGSGTALADSQVASLSERDSIRSQVLLDSVISLANRQPQIQEVAVVTQVVARDTIYKVDTLLVEVASEPLIQIVRVRDTIQVLIIDTVFAPPQIITIPAPDYGYFSSHYFQPRAGNLLYLLGGVALGHLIGSDASACILVSTTGSLERNCDPKQ